MTELEPRVTRYLPGTENRRCSSMFCHSVTICLSLSHYPWMPHFAFKMCHFTSARDIQLSLLTAFYVSRLLALLEQVPLGVCGSVHHSIIHKENPTRCNSVSKFYLIFIWSSTCFGRHTAHHQEPKTALAASGFAYVEGCWKCSCWTLSRRVWYMLSFI